ncbi:MAG: class I SAM-dependent methyltransferase [Gammaproteobacteria bacterium]|jgi:SAM-dependent methyltransferase|nr:class I SAM-dependent methyltransferase [Gammaproteobacteria bacterium]
MANSDSLLPPSPVAGLIPTMNNTGWMTESLDEISLSFTEYAGSISEEVLDMGCAYGIATLAALDNGARICACDIEPKHLDILGQRIPKSAKSRYRSIIGKLPAVNFEPESFGAIVASRVLHFLNGPDVDTTVQKMYDWLKPGGRIFLIADSPYTGPWAKQSDDYERRKAAGEKWPAFYDNYADFLSPETDASVHPSFINPMDPDILQRVCEAAGFKTLEARFLSGATKWSSAKDHAGIIAVKPQFGEKSD